MDIITTRRGMRIVLNRSEKDGLGLDGPSSLGRALKLLFESRVLELPEGRAVARVKETDDGGCEVRLDALPAREIFTFAMDCDSARRAAVTLENTELFKNSTLWALDYTDTLIWETLTERCDPALARLSDFGRETKIKQRRDHLAVYGKRIPFFGDKERTTRNGQENTSSGNT